MSGIVRQRKCYSGKKVNDLSPMIERVRQELLKNYSGRDDSKRIYTGNRFKSDSSVIARLESMNQAEIKRIGWEQAIRSALVDCMSSDYYYMFEKEY